MINKRRQFSNRTRRTKRAVCAVCGLMNVCAGNCIKRQSKFRYEMCSETRREIYAFQRSRFVVEKKRYYRVKKPSSSGDGVCPDEQNDDDNENSVRTTVIDNAIRIKIIDVRLSKNVTRCTLRVQSVRKKRFSLCPDQRESRETVGFLGKIISTTNGGESRDVYTRILWRAQKVSFFRRVYLTYPTGHTVVRGALEIF